MSLSLLQALVVYAEDKVDAAAAAKCPCPVYLWKDFLELGKDVDNKVRLSRTTEGVAPARA